MAGGEDSGEAADGERGDEKAQDRPEAEGGARADGGRYDAPLGHEIGGPPAEADEGDEPDDQGGEAGLGASEELAACYAGDGAEHRGGQASRGCDAPAERERGHRHGQGADRMAGSAEPAEDPLAEGLGRLGRTATGGLGLEAFELLL